MRFACALVGAVSLAVACDDGPSNPGGANSTTRSLSGHVTLLYEGLGVARAKVALVEAVPYRVVAGPVTTDTEGFYTFLNPPVGDWYLFVFSDSAFVFDVADARVTIPWNSSVTHDVELIRSEL
jgi:hypothetical protein